jgi:thiol:disulfide interchange protein/DsbC/DsbD-like thiol-disulfide interchange protein
MQILALLVAALATLFAPQQPKAQVEFFARSEGADVRGAVQIRISPRWHLYASDLGDPNAIGLPTTLEFRGEGLVWGEPRWPEAETETQPYGKDGKPARARIYEGTIVVHVAGRLAEGAKLENASVAVSGQTCETGGTCVPFDAEASVTVGGPDAVFASFPSDLALAQEPAAAAEAAQEVAGDEFAPYEDPEAHAKAQLFVREVEGEARAAIRIEIDETWHLFHHELGPPDAIGQPTVVTLGGPGIEWGPVTWPEPHKADQEWGRDGKPTWILQHENGVVLYARGRLAPGADVSKAHVEITGQTCDPLMCTTLETRVRSSGKGADALFAKFPEKSAESRGSGSKSSGEPGSADRGPAIEGDELGWGQFLWLAVFWGVISLLMPCTYPMIPITISFFTKQAAENPSKRFVLSAVYGLGIVLIFIAIGVVVGRPIIEFATHPATNLVIGAFFVVFALSLLGLFNLEPPAFLMSAAGQARMAGGYLGVFLMGATLVVTSFTCTAPFVGSLLSVGATTGNFARIVAGMGAFGLTMAVPFVLLSLVPGKLKALPRSGEWMNTLKVTLGFLELAAALKFLSNADLAYQWMVLPRELFLLLWFGIFAITAVYLFGLIRYHGESGEIGSGRLVSGLLFALFSLYCLFGSLGNRLDFVMTAMAPPYSAGRVAAFQSGGGPAAAANDHEIVKDDLDAAIARAKEQGKLALVNFTGHT